MQTLLPPVPRPERSGLSSSARSAGDRAIPVLHVQGPWLLLRPALAGPL